MTEAIAHLIPAPGRDRERVDLDAAALAAHDLLVALGVDLSDPSVSDTPRRVARMYSELLTPRPFNPTTFPNDGGYDEQEFLALTGGHRG